MSKHRSRVIDASSARRDPPSPARPQWSVILLGLREARGITQDGWAARLGYGRSTVQRWERGEAVPSADAGEALGTLCREEGLFRTYARGRLGGMTLSAELLRELLAEARHAAEARPLTEARDGPPVLPTKGEPTLHLPPQLTSFLGREPDLARLARLLETSRLLTLVGPPGVGKTRLAVEGARAVGALFPDGVSFVSLAPLNDTAQVLPAIAQRLGVGEGRGIPLGEVLIGWLRPKDLLLVLDNFEHVVEAGPEVLDLLGACPRIRVIVTSRTPLHLSGEQLLPVAPLPVPVAPEATPEGILEGFAAVRLFVERARAVQPDFAPALDELRTVAAVCKQLDGLPLAIELAAARVRLFPPSALLPRLSGRLRLLTTAALDQPARQRTLRATIDWSYALLAPDEQAVLRRLGVFAGGCSLEAAGVVGAGEGVAEDAVPDVVARLVDKSLVVPDAAGDDVRIRLLETIRAYAAECLGASGEADRARDRHRDWFVALAERAEIALRGPDQLAWARRLDAEQDNLRAALARSLDQTEGAEAALRLVGALAPWWSGRNLTEGKAWLVRALARKDEVDPAVRGKALGNGSWLAFRQGDYDLARALASELLATSRERSDPRGALAALRTLGGTLGEREGDAMADVLERESLKICRELGECWETAHQLYILAVSRNRCQDYATARAYLEESLPMLRKLGDRQTTILALQTLAETVFRQGDDQTAERLLNEGLEANRASGSRTSTAFCLAQLAAIARQRGDLATARARLDESLRLYWEAGDRPSVGRVLCYQAGLAVAEGRVERAVRLFGASEALRVALGVTWILPAEQVEYDADVAAARSRLAEASFERLWSEGRTMTPEQAIDDALSSG